MMNGIDCAAPLTAKTATAIKANGYGFVGRYLVPAKGSLKWKALTKDEARVISNAVLKLLTVYETTADRAKGGAVHGALDGATAKACAEAIGTQHQQRIHVQLLNCYIGGAIWINQYTSSSLQQFDLELLKCGTPTITIDIGADNPYPPQVFN